MPAATSPQVLREKVRKYRGQAQELERQLGSRDKRLYAMEDELGRLREAAQVRGAGGWC
jgi:hypothetical protein